MEKITHVRALHAKGSCFVVPNAWNAGSARVLADLGFAALATTSAGYAFGAGKRDSFAALSRAEVLANASDIAAATDLPVTADLEDGFGPGPDDCALTIRQAIAGGLAGGSIEDATGDPDDPIHPFDSAVMRVRAAVEAAQPSGFVITARAENYLWGRPDLDDTIARLVAFAQAGADVVYAPGLPDLDAIARVCTAVPVPVNVVMGLSGAAYSVDQLRAAGVTRVSTGGSLARAAFGALRRAAVEIRDHGTFGYARDALPDAELAALMAQDAPFRR